MRLILLSLSLSFFYVSGIYRSRHWMNVRILIRDASPNSFHLFPFISTLQNHEYQRGSDVTGKDIVVSIFMSDIISSRVNCNAFPNPLIYCFALTLCESHRVDSSSRVFVYVFRGIVLSRYRIFAIWELSRNPIVRQRWNNHEMCNRCIS